MKSIVPYTKDITFETKIAEICSISLEHELAIHDSSIDGEFIISGEYKTHEVSVNKESFLYKLPFTLEVTENILKDSIDFEITDFTYEVVNDNTLRVNIEFSLTASEKEEEKEEMEEIVEEDKEKETVRESVMEEINEMFPIEENEETEKLEEESNDERLDKESENIILDSVENKESEFATYHIHIVNNNDSIESICQMYNVDEATLKEYNTLENITVGNKIIIPYIDE